jgi:hypothetical protein
MASPPAALPPLHCHPEPFAVVLSEAKNLALGAQGKLREGSRSAFLRGDEFQGF